MSSEVSSGFTPPPYPYDRLESVAELASKHPGGMIDLSVGTPVDSPIKEVVEALSSSNAEKGYPASLGSVELRGSMRDWLVRRFGVDIPIRNIASCIGTKEFVASTPWYLKLRNPSKDTVLYPAVSYPTYALGAELAQCRPVPVAVGDGGRLQLDSINPQDLERAVMLWSNSPSNPTGELDDLRALYDFANKTSIPVFSDECYAEFTWSGEPDSILKYGSDNVVAVHSLSKRSNLAGIRVGFYAGDSDLVDYLALVRKHAGMMVPGPMQHGASIAFKDDAHVELQRRVYSERLQFMRGIFTRRGYDVPAPKGGFYLWFRSELEDGFELAAELARDLGILVSPGEFYGIDSRPFVRVAMVADLGKLELVAQRAEMKERF
ncbi:MAG: aminotransferase class I/II-fold pyridoxal phosphate-dependent enzyme [Actinomycetota bacterium]|nr:MAG: aminotransferase class I/II-fold pyridoxal phosphate-dependent enzyme [Actinomycetota bacterium]